MKTKPVEPDFNSIEYYHQHVVFSKRGDKLSRDDLKQLSNLDFDFLLFEDYCFHAIRLGKFYKKRYDAHMLIYKMNLEEYEKECRVEYERYKKIIEPTENKNG